MPSNTMRRQFAAGLLLAEAIDDKSQDRINGPWDTNGNVALYIRAGRSDLAMPLLAKAFSTHDFGFYYSPRLLWIDPVWDAVRARSAPSGTVAQVRGSQARYPANGDRERRRS